VHVLPFAAMTIRVRTTSMDDCEGPPGPPNCLVGIGKDLCNARLKTREDEQEHNVFGTVCQPMVDVSLLLSEFAR
jgi:hypothetical protein